MRRDVLDRITDASLRAYVAWAPILPEDSEDAARDARALVPDPRASHFWDAQRSLSPLFARLLGLPDGVPAWDVYLAYARHVRWSDAPPAPEFWHHQLGESVEAPVLDGAAFASGVRRLLRA
jgi:hypothetical protein